MQKIRLSYIPSLDGIRGVFCILIIINHWSLYFPISPIGWEVLQTFFVMSGFLITRILVVESEKHATFRSYVKSFYTKRSLRIFPLYFIYIGFWGLARLIAHNSEFIIKYTQELADHWPLYLTYTSNLKALADVRSQDTPFFAHLWSLGLEEQFYLIMPFLIYFMKGRHLKIAVLTVILLPFLTRTLGQYLLTQYHDNDIWASVIIYRNLPFQMDSFGLGAALALFNMDWIKHPKRWLAFLFAVFIGLTVYHYTLIAEFTPKMIKYFSELNPELGIAEGDAATVGSLSTAFKIMNYMRALGHPELLPMGRQYIYMMPLVNVMVFLLLLTCIRGEPVFRRLFENKLMINMGKVTYGMYVFHYCLIVIFLKAISVVTGHSSSLLNPLLHIPAFLVYLFILYQVSKFSFHYIEAPFLKIKNKVK